jgi:hypothetical protein
MQGRFFLLGAVVATLLVCACGSGMCGNAEVTRLGSADGSLDAVLFQRDCGATTGFSTQVSVVRAGERLADEGGNAFVADADHGRAPSASWGGPPATVCWRDARTLVVRYHPSARVSVSPPFVEVSTGWFARTRVELEFETAQ